MEARSVPPECPRWNAALRMLRERENVMLWTVAVILMVLWLLGMASSYTMGGFIHGLLVLAIIVVLLRLIHGRRLTTS